MDPYPATVLDKEEVVVKAYDILIVPYLTFYSVFCLTIWICVPVCMNKRSFNFYVGHK